MTRISVIGTGYLGTTHAACLASLGYEVFAYDIDKDKIDRLSKGDLPFYEPGLEKLIKSGLSTKKLKFTNDISEAITNSDLNFLCVGTPQLNESGAADTSQIKTAINAIAPYLRKNSIVIGKSTVPVGTAAWINDFLSEKSANEVSLVWNPEFLREGFAVEDTLNPDRIVLGSEDQNSAQKVAEIYRESINKGAPVIYTDFATAELVKVAANAFLATKISFINAFADLCDATGANVTTLADAIGYDSRIGRKFLNAGIGFGGGCLPKDIRALQSRATELGLSEQFSFLKNVDQINLNRRNKIIELVERLLVNVAGKNIAVLGASFKPDSDDIRDSPSLKIAQELNKMGAKLKLHDPAAIPSINKTFPDLHTELNIEDAVKNADLILHLTEWKIYRDLDPKIIGKLVRQKIIIDGRNVLNEDLWKKSAWKINFLGKPSS